MIGNIIQTTTISSHSSITITREPNHINQIALQIITGQSHNKTYIILCENICSSRYTVEWPLCGSLSFVICVFKYVACELRTTFNYRYYLTTPFGLNDSIYGCISEFYIHYIITSCDHLSLLFYNSGMFELYICTMCQSTRLMFYPFSRRTMMVAIVGVEMWNCV